MIKLEILLSPVIWEFHRSLDRNPDRLEYTMGYILDCLNWTLDRRLLDDKPILRPTKHKRSFVWLLNPHVHIETTPLETMVLFREFPHFIGTIKRGVLDIEMGLKKEVLRMGIAQNGSFTIEHLIKMHEIWGYHHSLECPVRLNIYSHSKRS